MTLDLIGGASYAPRKFLEGLNYWRSSLDSTGSSRLDASTMVSLSQAGDDTYGKVIVSKDQASVEIIHHENTPIAVGQYLEISFTVRLVSGSAPSARIVGRAMNAGGTALSGRFRDGPSTELVTGVEHEISAIVGASARDGVDFAWGEDAVLGHFGLELLGANGAQVLVNNMQVRDVTAAFTALHTGIVDIRDYGAIGDGSTDNRNAFVAADGAANGRTIFVPEGSYFVGSAMTIHSPMQFSGAITCADDTPIMFAHRFDLEVYVHAFQDEEYAFFKAFQALFRFSDHHVLDMCGRVVSMTKPIRFAEVISSGGSKHHRVLRDGTLSASSSAQWDNVVVTSDADYATVSGEGVMSNVDNIGTIPIGAHVTGPGVGREIYVIDKDEDAGTLTLSNPFYGVNTRQNYTFERYQYMLDFCEVSNLRYFVCDNIFFDGNSVASHVMLAREGTTCRFMHCQLLQANNRNITSYAYGCNGLVVESCVFDGGEYSTPVAQRKNIAISTNKSDLKFRNNRASYYRHFAVMRSSGHLLTNNHVFQGGPGETTELSAAIVGTDYFARSVIANNYIDNAYIEMSNEASPDALYGSGADLGKVSICNNHFMLTNKIQGGHFNFIKFRIIGSNCQLQNISVIGNVTTAYADGNLDRIEGVDTSLGSVDYSKCREIYFYGNTVTGVDHETHAPATKKISRTSAASTWTEDFASLLPFGCMAMEATGVVCNSDLTTHTPPKIQSQQGTNGTQIKLQFASSTKGSVAVTVTPGALN